MRTIFLVGLITTFTACRIMYKVPPIESDEAAWITAYKTIVFLSCMNSDGQNSTDISKAICFDIIGNTNYFNRADSIGKKLSQKILPSPILDFEGGKPLTIQCLDYYKSGYLDSIAKKEYKKFKQNKD